MKRGVHRGKPARSARRTAEEPLKHNLKKMTDSKLIGYLSMIEFLEAYSERNSHPDEIQSLLGQLYFLEDGSTADPATEEDWQEAYEKAEKYLNNKYKLKFERK